MSDLIAGFGIAMVLEGLLWALAPSTARRVVSELSGLKNSQLQPAALVAVAAGVALVWLARG
jgi:uncharacterized protein